MKSLCCLTDLHSYTNTEILTKKTWTMISKNSYSNCSFTSFPVPLPSCIIPVYHSSCIKNQLLRSSVTAQVRFTVNIYLWDLRHAFGAYCCEDISKSKNLYFCLRQLLRMNFYMKSLTQWLCSKCTQPSCTLFKLTSSPNEHTFLTPCSVLGVYNTRKSCIAGLFRTRRRGGRERDHCIN